MVPARMARKPAGVWCLALVLQLNGHSVHTRKRVISGVSVVLGKTCSMGEGQRLATAPPKQPDPRAHNSETD